jgi:hypothetical protein
MKQKNCKCGKNIFSEEKYCDKCFLKIFEKRIRKELQNYKWFKKKEKALIIDDKTTKTKIIKELVQPLIETAQIHVETGKKEKKGYRTISPENLEDTAEKFLETTIKNKKLKKDKKIRPLQKITDAEINQYAKIKKLKRYERKKSRIITFLDELEKKNPEIKYSLLKIIEQLKR